MVSINHLPPKKEGPGSLIYIPLWYLLINVRTIGISCAPDIYIPLWYLLIDTPPLKSESRENHLHSTMVSINPGDHQRDKRPCKIYIPLWYLLILKISSNSALSSSFTFHYGIY